MSNQNSSNDAAQTLRTNLETLGITDMYPPGEQPDESDEWHYTTRHDTCAVIESTGDMLHCSKTYGEKTSFTYQHSTTTHSWHCGTLNVSYNHEPANPDDVESENAVYGAYVYVSMNWIKPVENRETEHDRRRHDREELLAVDANTPVSIEYVLDAVTTAQDLLTSKAEATDDTYRQERIDRAEQHWSDEQEEYVLPDSDDQAMLNAFN